MQNHKQNKCTSGNLIGIFPQPNQRLKEQKRKQKICWEYSECCPAKFSPLFMKALYPSDHCHEIKYRAYKNRNDWVENIARKVGNAIHILKLSRKYFCENQVLQIGVAWQESSYVGFVSHPRIFSANHFYWCGDCRFALLNFSRNRC